MSDMSKIATPQIRVSDEFIDVYMNFNVSSQLDKMKILSEKELYLLLILCLDKHCPSLDSEKIDPVVSNNFSEYQNEIKEIFKIQDDQKSDVDILNDLTKETGNSYIDVEILVDQKGDKLPDTMDKGQVRDAKLDNIID